ncbi:hypothetical protein [uncultured Rikenella sp.]|uniref:hypothetical protein n=1 Tax=uncultured Rikenella sp. TaxID=368003 RepID=UPI00272AFDD5|nr:hypothetical protein [uncultured Rikenella sp.]
MRHILLLCTTIACCCILWGCQFTNGGHVPDNKALAKEALSRAGKNRVELEKVLRYYQAPEDSQKLQAAYFLIANMPGKNTVTALNHDRYRRLLAELGALTIDQKTDQQLDVIRIRIDSISSASPASYIVRPDLETVSADYLIHNINESFAAWEKTPWHKRYSFEDFCEWVLPYREGNEDLEDWRALAMTLERPGEDMLQNIDSILKWGVVLINNSGQSYSAGILHYPLPLTLSDMKTVGVGACGTLTQYAAKVFRSRGIPAGMDFIPAWGNRSSTHAWNSIILPEGKSEGIGYQKRGILVVKDKIPKIYRKRFSLLRSDALYRFREVEDIPDFFSGYDMEDVTTQYNMQVADVKIEGLKSPGRLIWLSCFNNTSWVPVAYAEKQKGCAEFRNLGCGAPIRKGTEIGNSIMVDTKTDPPYSGIGDGIVYLPIFYLRGKKYPAQAPFILHTDGMSERLVADVKHTQKVILDRKYPQHEQFAEFAQRAIGGRFEGANHPNFSDATILHEITSVQDHPFQSHPVEQSCTFRYLRYVAPDSSFANLAEIRFYEDTVLLTGKMSGTPGRSSANDPKALFDGDPLSYYVTAEPYGTSAVLDLGGQRRITSIAYCVRTDMNEIWPGCIYEMWYWDNDWVSLGEKKALGYSVEWDNAPKGALYLIRNLTHGKEQRIFTWQNNQVVWW